jgi:hypothetical protein
MNLWVKRTGRLSVAALLLMSCEDDSFLLGFKNQANKFNVKYQEFLVGDGTVLSIDSVITDNLSTAGRRLLIGEHNDPEVGTIRTEAFAEFLGDGIKLAAKADHTYVYDSIVVQLHLDNYSYGLSGNAVGKFGVHRITEALTYSTDEFHTIPGSDKEVLVKVPHRYYATSTAAYDADLLGEMRFEKLYMFDKKERRIVTTVTLEKLKNAKDTLVASTRLPDALGEELFGVALNNDNEEFSDRTKFRARFKGLSFIPHESNTVLGFNPGSSYSRVRLYYHSVFEGDVKDTLSRDFGFSGVSFHSITPTRSGGLPPVTPAYSGVEPGSMRVIQSGNAMVTKIDINKFYEEFANTVTEKDIVINAAELVIEGVDSPEGYTPIPLLELRVMQEDDSYLNYRTLSQQDRDSIRLFYVFTDSRNYYVNSDFVQSQSSIAASLFYNSTKKAYTGNVTLFVQNLFNKKNSSYRFQHLGLYPGTSVTGSTNVPPVGKTVDRSIFQKENIKLRVYYTQPNKSNL